MTRIEDFESALTINWAQADHIRVDPVRRLTGPSLLWARSGAVVDIHFDAMDGARLIAVWEAHVRRVLDGVGWVNEDQISRVFHGGVSLAISAPPDQLYSAIFAVQTAWHFCAADLLNAQAKPFDDMIRDLRGVMAQEANPALMALIKAASAHDVDILLDDDEVSIGHGTGSLTWSIEALPTPDAVDWSTLHDVPLAFITGTNGKTTTTRLCAAIMQTVGHVVGQSSTDVVQVGEDILDRGDYSGPGGARMVLRDPRVSVACLEVARGGILRRGLATRRARVAMVTNIAPDHLGEYGIGTLADLTQAKFAVARALLPDGVLVLNADDPNIVDAARNITSLIWWISLDSAAPQIVQAQRSGHPCAYLLDDALVFFDGETEILSLNVNDVPITLSGAAKHNIYNALAATCTCFALGASVETIRISLCDFVSDSKTNPGRLNEFTYNGAKVVVDFAHNAHSVNAVCKAMAAMPAQRRLLMLSQPGDHSDQVINDVTTAALAFKPAQIVVAEIADYLRGRSIGEVPYQISTSAISKGYPSENILQAASPSVGAKLLLENVKSGDLLLLLVLSDREAVFEALATR